MEMIAYVIIALLVVVEVPFASTFQTKVRENHSFVIFSFRERFVIFVIYA